MNYFELLMIDFSRDNLCLHLHEILLTLMKCTVTNKVIIVNSTNSANPTVFQFA